MKRGTWHTWPQIPETECLCMIRIKGFPFVENARFVWVGTNYYFCVTRYNSDLNKYEDIWLHGDQIECWCGLEELAELLDKKEAE